MLRFLYTISDLLAGMLAISSPVAIFHWLVKVTNITAAEPYAAILNPIFEPLNDTLNTIIQLPILHYNGHDIPTTQGALACLMTAGFFLFNFCSEYLKAAEQRLDVEKQAFIQRRRLQQLKTEQQHFQKQVTGSTKLYMVVQYDFKGCPSGAASFETTYSKSGGKLIESSPQMLALEFEGPERAFHYALTVSQAIQSYYATLRPIDPQPPYQIAIQAIDSKLPGSEAILKMRKLVSYTGQNQILFGPEVHTLISQQGIIGRFHFQSVGVYIIEGRQMELYRLFYEKREQRAF
jgi:hypothetical protein